MRMEADDNCGQVSTFGLMVDDNMLDSFAQYLVMSLRINEVVAVIQ